MKELLEYIARSLVDDPEQVSVKETHDGNTILLELRVSAEDTGRVIGKSGRVANSIRSVLRVAAAKEGKRVQLDII